MGRLTRDGDRGHHGGVTGQARGQRREERRVDVAPADDRPAEAEPGPEHRAQKSGRDEAALVGVHLPDVEEEEQGHAERADRDQRRRRARQGEDQQQDEDGGERDAKRSLGPLGEMGEERGHDREPEDRLIGEGGIGV
jgi:hypothetical protein